MAYYAIYEKLAADPHDLVGAFAYIAYKQQKVDYCKSFGGRELSREELCSFHLIAALDTSLLTYRRQGEALAQSFLNASLDDLVERAEAAAKKDTLSKQIEAVQAVLSTRLAGIDKGIHAKRSFVGWLRDISTNLLVNLVSIFVLGALLLGYRLTGDLQQQAQARAGLDGAVNAATATTSASRSALPPGPPATPLMRSPNRAD